MCLFTLALLALTFVAPQRCVCESADRGLEGFGSMSPGVSWLRMNELNEHVRGLKSQTVVAKCEPKRLAYSAQSEAQRGSSGQLMSRKKKKGASISSSLSNYCWFTISKTKHIIRSFVVALRALTVECFLRIL